MVLCQCTKVFQIWHDLIHISQSLRASRKFHFWVRHAGYLHVDLTFAMDFPIIPSMWPQIWNVLGKWECEYYSTLHGDNDNGGPATAKATSINSTKIVYFYFRSSSSATIIGQPSEWQLEKEAGWWPMVVQTEDGLRQPMTGPGSICVIRFYDLVLAKLNAEFAFELISIHGEKECQAC